MTLFVILFFAILLIPDIYGWALFVRHAGALTAALWWLPTAAALVVALAWASGHLSGAMIKAFFILLMCFAVPKLLFMLLSLVGLAVGRWAPHVATAFNIAGIAAGVAFFGCSVYGFTRGIRRLETRRLTVVLPRLPQAFDGYRMVHISDLHAGTFGDDTDFIGRLVETVNALDADAVLFTGDIVNSSPDELTPHREALARIRARDGVFSVLGNHDYCQYARYDTPDGAARNTLRVIDAERGMGWRVLMNEHALVVRGGDTLAIAGVENVGLPPFPSRGDLAQTLDGLSDDICTVLLSHDPSHWRREVLGDPRVDLMLAGHTHAMQFEMFGLSPSALSYREWGGLYSEGDRRLHVSKGAGGTAPFRFGAWPEITEITLRRQ